MQTLVLVPYVCSNKHFIPVFGVKLSLKILKRKEGYSVKWDVSFLVNFDRQIGKKKGNNW